MPLSVTEIVTDHQAYAAHRPAARRRMIPLRAERRVRVGDMIVFEFENADTLRYQVQEMVYTERLSDPAEVAHEVDAYSRMLPTSHELCATMFIELPELATVRSELRRLAGVQHGVRLDVGGVAVPGVELPGLDEDPDRPSETVAVHVVRFRLDDARRDAFRDPSVPVELVVEHPEYHEATPLGGATRASLIADLATEG